MTSEVRQLSEATTTAEVDLLDPLSDHYAMIPNAVLRDHSISTDARAILCEWLSHTKSWRFDLQQTAAENGLTRERARRAVKELRTAGYVHFIKVSHGRGKFTNRYRVSNKAGVKCRTAGCQDCGPTGVETPAPTQIDGAIGTRKSSSRTDQAQHPVSAGHFGTTNKGLRKSSSQVLEDHVPEDHKKEDQEERLSLSGLGRRIAARLGAAGATDVGEREISSIEGEIKSRAKGPVTAYLRAIPDDDLRALLDEYRANVADHQRRQQEAAEAAAAAAEQAAATASLPACTHGVPAGSAPLRPGLPPRCPLCRKGLADDGEAFTPASRDAIDEAKRKLAGLAGTVRTADGGSRPA
jgi:hypothetical protein